MSRAKINEWEKSFDLIEKVFTRRKQENMQISPDFRPDLIARIKEKRYGNEAEYHSLLVSLVRLGVDFSAV